MTCHNPTLLDHLLNSHEGIGKVLRILHRWHIVAYLTQALGESRTAKSLLVETEVDMVDGCVLIIYQDWRNDLLNVADLTTGRYNHCSRRDNLLTIRILLTQ